MSDWAYQHVRNKIPYGFPPLNHIKDARKKLNDLIDKQLSTFQEDGFIRAKVSCIIKCIILILKLIIILYYPIVLILINII